MPEIEARKETESVNSMGESKAVLDFNIEKTGGDRVIETNEHLSSVSLNRDVS